MDYAKIYHERISFQSGEILRSEMLQSLHDFEKNIATISYQTHADGIVAGFDFAEQNGELIMLPGIVKFEGELYLLDKALNITEICKAAPDSQYYFGFTFEKGEEKHNILTKTMQLSLDKERSKLDLLLGKVLEGMRPGDLPTISNTASLANFSEQNVYYNILLLPYSLANSKTTWHPYVFREIARFLQAKNEKDYLDYSLLFTLENNPLLDLATLETYTAAKGYIWGKNTKENLEGLGKALGKTLQFTAVQASVEEKKPDKALNFAP